MRIFQLRPTTAHYYRRVMLLAAAATLAAVPLRQAEAQGPSSLTIQQEQGSVLAAKIGDKTLWEFHYDSKLPKPFFHPVATMDGHVMTWNSPPDHPWHHGLWFSWKYINGVNYWEPNGQTGKPDGRTQWNDVQIKTLPDGTARIQMQVKYGPANQGCILSEERSIAISPPDSNGDYHFDWTSKFTATGEQVVLDRTPLPDEPGGEVYGGYAGLSVRFAKALTAREATSSKGPVQFNSQSRYRGRATAMDYAGEIDGQPVGIAICGHPGNLNHPSPWYVIRSGAMSYYSPAVICYGPHTMKTGDSFTLRYRVIVHDGKWNADRLTEEYNRFAIPASTN